jgi:FkbM family methyltransferase
MYNVSERRTGEIFGKTFTFLCDPDPKQHPTWWCFTDEKEVRERWWKIGKDEIVLDCGAAFGSYTLPALAQGAAHVYAWSPEGMDVVLNKNLDANGWTSKCTVFKTGLWSKIGCLKCPEKTLPRLFMNEVEAKKDPEQGATFMVSTLDFHIPPSLKHVDWIKLDVEGAEVEVLRGGKGVLNRWKPRILVENHLFKDPSIDKKVNGFLDSLNLGYVLIATIPYHGVSHSLYVVK